MGERAHGEPAIGSPSSSTLTSYRPLRVIVCDTMYEPSPRSVIVAGGSGCVSAAWRPVSPSGTETLTSNFSPPLLVRLPYVSRACREKKAACPTSAYVTPGPEMIHLLGAAPCIIRKREVPLAPLMAALSSSSAWRSAYTS